MRPRLLPLSLGAGLLATVALALLAPLAVRAQVEPGVPEVFEARAEAGGVHDSIAVPAYFETFVPYSLSEASNGSSHAYQAVFYGGFFLTAAAGQFGFPPPPGTSETLFPQGPVDQTAEAIPADPGSFGESEAHSAATGARGRATMGGGGGGGLALGMGTTTSEVAVDAGAVRSTATVSMSDVDLGGAVRIGSVAGRAQATASGQPGGAGVEGSLILSNVTVAGAPLDVPAFEVPAVPGVDQVFSAVGLTVRRLPEVREVAADGTSARIELGGVQFVLARPEREFTLTVTFGRLRVSARALPPVLAVEPAAATVIPGSPGGVDVLGASSGLPDLVPPVPAASQATPSGAVRVRSVAPVRGLDASAAAALVAALVLALPVARRVINPDAPRRSP